MAPTMDDPTNIVIERNPPSWNLNVGDSSLDNWGNDSEPSCLSLASHEKCFSGPLHPRTISDSTESNTISSRKSVSFSSWVDVEEVPHLADFSQEEIEELWLGKSEYQAIKLEAKQSVAFKLKYGLTDDDLEFCSRGLETPSDVGERRSCRTESINAVLNEQYLQQWEDGRACFTPEFISMLYWVYSYPSLQKAHSRALQDAIDVDDQQFEAYCNHIDLEEGDAISHMPIPEASVFHRILRETPPLDHVEDPMATIQRWLVERFKRGETLVQVHRVHQLTTKARSSRDTE